LAVALGHEANEAQQIAKQILATLSKQSMEVAGVGVSVAP
jgi:hypothetical protein